MPADYRQLMEGVGSAQFERLCALLAGVERRGSLRQATAELGLSYRYAWGLIKKAEERIEAPLLIRRAGGAAGGGAELTEAARALLRRHRVLQQETEAILGPREPEPPGSRPLLMASTIGPVEVGLVDALAAAYRAATGPWVRCIAAGSGQALELARTGRADLVLVHAPDLEEAFLRDGFGTRRHPLTINTLVLCGPADDPAGIRTAQSAAEAMQRIAAQQSPFVSRGDQSGTHVHELALWRAAGVSPTPPWYQVWPLGGQGSAATLRHAAAIHAYTLCDSATLATVRPEGAEGLFRKDPVLENRFSLIPVNPDRVPTVNYPEAERFVAWATGPEGRAVVRRFGAAEYGSPLFTVPETVSH